MVNLTGIRLPKLPQTLCLATAGLIVGLAVSIAEPASAQGLKHFYMARQQVQITDDAPLVNDQRTFPQGGQPGAGMGALPNRPMALPRAGFQQYSPSMPSFNTRLPQVVNGVPPREQPAAAAPVKKGKNAKTGALKVAKDKAATTSSAAATKPPVTAAKSYSPYKGYNPATPAGQPAQAVSNNANMQSKTRVKGSVLHWARGH